MPASELTNTQALIDRYYTEEKAKKEQALTRAELNLQLDANDLAMLSTIAKRFGKSRVELAKDVLSHALIDLLTQIESGERKIIARDADDMALSMATEIAEENGLKDIEHKPNVWAGHDRTISRAEKKRAKALEDAKKAEKKKPSAEVSSNESSTTTEMAAIESTEAANSDDETIDQDSMNQASMSQAEDNSEASASESFDSEDSQPEEARAEVSNTEESDYDNQNSAFA